MIYSNDESDKSARQNNYYLTVYVLPILLMAAICGATYMASEAGYLSKADSTYCYFLSLTPAVFLYGFNRRHWLKMPDGTFHNMKGISPTPKVNFSEPSHYEAEYFNSKTQKASTAFSGITLIAVSIWLGFKGQKMIMLPLFTNAMGLFLAYTGLKDFFDKEAKLKIAKNGLWTKRLGFVNWDDINFANVVEDRSGKKPQLFLEIRLKGTKYEEADQPDERLLLSELNDKDDVELVVNNSITQYNEQKKITRSIL